MKPFEREWIERADALSCLFVLFLISLSPISTPSGATLHNALTQSSHKTEQICQCLKPQNTDLQGETECIDLNKDVVDVLDSSSKEGEAI